MTALLPILRMIWPYVLCAGIASYLSHRWEQTRYDALQAKFSAYQTQVAQADEKAQQSARDALQAQIQTRLQTEANNGKVIAQLQAERDRAVSDRDIAQRLLIAAKAPAASSGGQLPKAPDRPTPPAASPQDSGGSLTEALAAAIDECRSNADQLDALIAEIRPQL